MLNKQAIAIFAGAAALVLATAATVACGTAGAKASGAPTFDTPYQAILLDTGLVYYGKVSGLDTDYPVLKDVYYVQQTKDDKGQVNNVLIRRGNEWHGPAETVLNARHIVLVEPVGTNSKVAQLIAEDQKKGK